uniref:Uncharacterized protein n=1 Tax=Sphaerodactylus townsendi TaxID=933632 RepID=A0ACB8F233_9SAUR
MDVQSETVPVPETPTEPLEAPPMDLGENATGAEETPPHNLGEDVHFIPPQQAVSGNVESRLGDPETRKDPDNMEGTRRLSDPQSTSLQGTAEEGSRNVEGAVGEPVNTVALEHGTRWARNTGEDLEDAGRPEAPPGADQLMDLEGEERRDGLEADQSLLAQFQRLSPSFHDGSPNAEDYFSPTLDGEEGQALEDERGPLLSPECQGLPGECAPCPLHLAMRRDLGAASHRFLRSARGWRSRGSRRLLSVEADQEDLLSLLRYEGGSATEPSDQTLLACSDAVAGTSGQVAQDKESASSLETPAWLERSPEPTLQSFDQLGMTEPHRCFARGATGEEDPNIPDSSLKSSSRENSLAPKWRTVAGGSSHSEEPPPPADVANKADLSSFPAYKEVPGPCEPEDLLDGVIFGAKYLGSTQLISERTPPTNIRMAQAQEAVDRIKEQAEH